MPPGAGPGIRAVCLTFTTGPPRQKRLPLGRDGADGATGLAALHRNGTLRRFAVRLARDPTVLLAFDLEHNVLLKFLNRPQHAAGSSNVTREIGPEFVLVFSKREVQDSRKRDRADGDRQDRKTARRRRGRRDDHRRRLVLALDCLLDVLEQVVQALVL